MSCELYEVDHEKWPVTLDQLKGYAKPFNIYDPWDNKIVLIPFDKNKGFGLLISYGSDGKKGGTGEAQDIVSKFGEMELPSY